MMGPIQGMLNNLVQQAGINLPPWQPNMNVPIQLPANQANQLAPNINVPIQLPANQANQLAPNMNVPIQPPANQANQHIPFQLPTNLTAFEQQLSASEGQLRDLSDVATERGIKRQRTF